MTTTESTAPLEPADLPVGGRVRLAHGSNTRGWWTVRAHVNERYAIATRQTPFERAGTLEYTVLDFELGIRGAINLIGYGYGDGTYSDEQIAAMAIQLAADQLEVSHRNNVPIEVIEVRP
jgi:hypothetical protein